MRPEAIYPALKAALLAGLAAGLMMGLFHLWLTEPVIDRAIALEDAAAMAAGQDTRYAPLVSRQVQKAMLVVGSALYGVLVGIVFAAVLVALGRRLPGRWPHLKAAALAAALGWSVAILPFLKYPANPPGVGDPETALYRQAIQLGFMALSVLAVVAAGAAYRPLGRRLGLAAGLYGILVVLLFVFMPPNPDPITAPPDLIREFRILSLSGLALFWAILGGASALLLRRFAQPGALAEAG